jgi:hypothetical protein
MRIQTRQGMHAFGGVRICFVLQRIHFFRAFVENSREFSFSFFWGEKCAKNVLELLA